MNRTGLIEAMARAICANEYRAGTWDESPVLQAQCIRKATAALSAIEAMAMVVPREDLIRVRDILWEQGESEAEYGPLWLVRNMLAAFPFAKEASDGQ